MQQAEPTPTAARPLTSVSLHQLAHARAGDKGFSHRGASRVRRYPLPNLAGMNFVIDDVLQGGVNGALNLDGHGKTLSFLLLSLEVTL